MLYSSRRRLLLLIGSMAPQLILSSALRADSFAYIVTGTQDFGTVDLNTGAFTRTGSLSQYSYGLGEINNTLYSVGNQNSDTLYTVNTSNGALTAVGNTGVAIFEMGSTTNGLFGLGQNNTDLYSINPVTGVATLIGATGVTNRTTSGLSVGAGGLYYYVSGPTSSTLYLLNTSTGAATLIGSSFPGVCLKNSAYENNTLYSLSGYCFAGSETYSVNVTTGATQFVANGIGYNDLTGLAPVLETATPEPTSAILLTTGLSLAAVILRAKRPLKATGRQA